MNFDLNTIVILWLGGSVVLMPLMIVALRFAVIPLIETILHPRDTAQRLSDRERIAQLEQRLAQIVAEMERYGRTGAARQSS